MKTEKSRSLSDFINLEAPPQNRRTSPSSPLNLGAVPIQLKRILIVDDEPPILDICTTVLQSKGYHIRSALNGSDAYKIVRSSALLFDLVLTDIMLPEMNGVDLYRALQKTYPDLCVAFMSGYKAEAQRDLHLPKDIHFLAKPFTPPQLLNFVTPLLKSE